MAKYWLHNGLLRRDEAGKIGGRAERDQPLDLEAIEEATDEKIARSKGAGGLADMIETYGGEQLRFFLVRTHYRSTVVLNDAALEEAKTALDAFYRFFERYQRATGESFYQIAAATQRTDGEIETNGQELLATAEQRRNDFLAKMDDDFNTAGASSELFELLRSMNKFVDQKDLESADANADDIAALKRAASTLRELAGILGLFHKQPEQSAAQDDALASQLMELIIELRAELRKKKDFELSDHIRDGLTAIGVTLEDRKEGTTWRQE